MQVPIPIPIPIDQMIVVSGDPDFINKKVVEKLVEEMLFPSDNVNITLLHTGRRGPETAAKHIAKAFKYGIIECKLDYKKNGNFAEPVRNDEIIDFLLSCNRRFVNAKILFFHRNIESSPAHFDLLNKAISKLIPVRVFTPQSL